jgi:hypothetical protein
MLLSALRYYTGFLLFGVSWILRLKLFENLPAGICVFQLFAQLFQSCCDGSDVLAFFVKIRNDKPPPRGVGAKLSGKSKHSRNIDKHLRRQTHFSKNC